MARRRGLSIACLLLPALLVLLALPAPRAEAGDGWWGGLDEGEAVSLADVLRGPRDYRGKTLTFFCIFHRKESYFDPVRTPFNPERYDNFSVWPDGAALWQEKAYVNDMPFLYIRRNHTQRDAIMRLDPVTRIENNEFKNGVLLPGELTDSGQQNYGGRENEILPTRLYVR